MKKQRRFILKQLILLGTAGLLNSCGFSIRGSNVEFPFKSVYVEGNQGVAQEVLFLLSGQRSLSVNPKIPEAQVRVVILSQAVERSIVAFNASGRPREIILRMRVAFRALDYLGIELIPTTELFQTRDLSISEAEILANPVSEGALNEDMQKDIAWQIVRRLRSVNLPN
ncbi:MAG: hypothetical protein RI937_1282 [Pseudomonadota bacterium]|jgi:LPS-assembly lipoprotein